MNWFTTGFTVPMAIGITGKITDIIILNNPCIIRVLSELSGLTKMRS